MNFLHRRRSKRNPEGRPRGRPPHPDVLTPAEWRVLEEVRHGHTNAEIAARTGLSFNTVKTHVANMLVKTGTRDRQELAAWQGEPAEVSRRRLGRGFALPLAGWSNGAKVVGAMAAGVVFLGAVWLVFGSLQRADEPSPATWTFQDGRLYVDWVQEFSVAGLPATSPDIAAARSAQPQLDPNWVQRNQLWWNGRDQWRAELTAQSSRVYAAEHRIVIGTADSVLHFDVLRHTVDEMPASEFWEHYYFTFWMFPIWAAVEGHDSIDEYSEAYLSLYGDPSLRDIERTHAGTSTHLGRTVEVIESPDGRTFIEPDTVFLVLSESPGFRFEVTEMRRGQPLDPQLFVLDPPADAGPIARGGPEGRGCGSPPQTPPRSLPRVPGFLTIQHVPDGWEVWSGGPGRSSGPWQPHCDIWTLTAQLSHHADREGYVWIEQVNLVHIPAHLQRGAPVEVGGHEGYRIEEGDLVQLVWAQDGVVAMLESDVLPFEELLRIAESAELVP